MIFNFRTPNQANIELELEIIPQQSSILQLQDFSKVQKQSSLKKEKKEEIKQLKITNQGKRKSRERKRMRLTKLDLNTKDPI